MSMLRQFMSFVSFDTESPTVNSERVAEPSDQLNRRAQIIQQLENSETYVWQQDLATSVGCSDSSVCRTLQELETRGTIVRHQVGRQKAVFLSGKEPKQLR